MTNNNYQTYLNRSLLNAVECNLADEVKRLVELGADYKYNDSEPLKVAFRTNQNDICQYFLKDNLKDQDFTEKKEPMRLQSVCQNLQQINRFSVAIMKDDQLTINEMIQEGFELKPYEQEIYQIAHRYKRHEIISLLAETFQ